MSMSNPYVKAAKASLELPILHISLDVPSDEVAEAARKGDAAAFEEFKAWAEPVRQNAILEQDTIKGIMRSLHGNGPSSNAGSGGSAAFYMGEKITATSLHSIMTMARHSRAGETFIEDPATFPVELISASLPKVDVEANLVVAIVRWDDIEGLNDADLSQLLARIKSKLEATWPLFEGNQYAHKNAKSGEIKIVLLGRVGDSTAGLQMKDGSLQHLLWEGDVPLFARASLIVILQEKAWAIDVPSLLYLTYRTTADIIWLFGEEEKPKHKVFRAQTLRKLLQETTAKNVLEILPFLVIEGMIEHLDMMRELPAVPDFAKRPFRLVCDALRTIQDSEDTPSGDSNVKLWPPVAVEGPNKTEHSISATYLTRVAVNGGGGGCA